MRGSGSDFGKPASGGSHVKLRRDDAVCIAPLHRELKKGTLAAILRQARLTPDDLPKALLQ